MMLNASDVQGLRSLAEATAGGPKSATDTDGNLEALASAEYDVEHLDYGYVRECTDLHELRVLSAVLRSGKEGLYPDLETAIEDRIIQVGGSLGPHDRRLGAVDEPTRSAAASEISAWVESLAAPSKALTESKKSNKSGPPLPVTDMAVAVDPALHQALADAENRKGHEALRSGDFQEAADAYARASVLQPSDPRFPANGAVAWQRAGNRDRAAACAQAALRLAPPPPLAYKCYLRLATARLGQARYRDALDALDQCARLAPEAIAMGAGSASVQQLLHEPLQAKARADWMNADFSAYRAWAEAGVGSASLPSSTAAAVSSKTKKKLQIVVVEDEDEEDDDE
ncbi:hypothetical protein BC828DRAFT_375332 [Blastocladiella britannica]|nr:hypothetical protein BC828DRAFT_375332 [Blastocladiella britannica]